MEPSSRGGVAEDTTVNAAAPSFAGALSIKCFVYNWTKRASSENFNLVVCALPTRHRWLTSTWSLGGFATSVSTTSRKVSVVES